MIEQFYEPLVTLAFLAGGTKRVRLGVSAYIVPYRPPVITAKQVASTIHPYPTASELFRWACAMLA